MPERALRGASGMTALVFCFLSVALAGCSDLGMDTPHVFGDLEVPPEILNQPRTVQTPTQADVANTDWPRLGDVPSKPADFSPQASIDAARQQMETDRAQARVIEKNYEVYSGNITPASATPAATAPAKNP